MLELQLYKFVTTKHCEWHWEPDGHLVIFIAPEDIKEFCKMLGRDVFDDGGLNCVQKLCADGDIALAEFENILEYFDIDARRLFVEISETELWKQ